MEFPVLVLVFDVVVILYLLHSEWISWKRRMEVPGNSPEVLDGERRSLKENRMSEDFDSSDDFDLSENTTSHLSLSYLTQVRRMGEEIRDLTDRLRQERSVPLDQRWVSIAVTHFQEGLMALRRGIERPEEW